jgi:hypothetical protein
MKHPVESDFDTSLTEAGVIVTFKRTSSIYSLYRLADTEVIARLASFLAPTRSTRGTDRRCGRLRRQ